MSDDSLTPLDHDPDQDRRPTEPAEPSNEPGAGFAWGAVIGLLALALIVVFAVQNTDPVPVRFLWLDGEYPLALVILIAVAAAILVAEVAGLAYRRRRKRRRAEREELKRYRETG